MGSFYCNVTLLGADLDEVRAIAPSPAFLVSDGGAVVVFAEVDDEGAPQSGQRLSSALNCVAVSIGVHDDDILMVEIHDRGSSLISGAVPDPAEYFGVDLETFAEMEPAGSADGAAMAASGSGGTVDAEAIVRALGRGDTGAVRAALGDDFVFATERHEVLAKALGLPLVAVGWGYRYLAGDSGSYEGPALTKV